MWLALVAALWAVGGEGSSLGGAAGSGGPGGQGGAQIDCGEARLRCAYRQGCGAALNNYLMWCSDMLHGAPGCPEPCQHALIALTSTDEGKELMDCECNDKFCQLTKQRVEVCRPQVLKASQNETVSCRVSQLICAADGLCATALQYYRRFCRPMFSGKKCTHRCLNSINILRKQEKAAKLSTCKCDGLEDYDCPRVQSNMARLCFHKTKPRVEESDSTTMRQDLRTNEVSGVSSLNCVASVLIGVVALNRFVSA